MSPDAAGTNLPSLYAAGDALSVYTVDSAAKSSIPSGGIYSGIVMGSGYSSFSVPTGNVTLAGGPGQALVSPGLNYATASTRNPAAPIVVGSDTSAASLTLIEGSITGDIALGSGSYGRDATLIIGAGSTGETVSITGSVIGHLGSLGVSSLVINGSSLQVTGDIGLPNNTGTIRVLDAGGDITTRRLSSSFLGDLNAYRVSVRTGKKIDVAGAARVWNLFLEENSSLTANQPVKGAGRVDVQNVIDGGENGILAPGSKIVSTSDSVWLWEGVTRGSGEIRSGASIGSHQGIHYSPAAEVMVNPINQGDGGHLTLNAGVDISTGNVTVDSLSAGQDIVSGTEFPTNAPLAGRIYIKNNLTSGIFSPRGTITARWIKAGSGIYAGAMNIGGQGDEGSAVGVEASNLIVVRENPPAGATSLPSSTGDFLLNNGYFKLTGADVGRKYPQSTDPDSWTLTWGARIDGNAKVEDNGASSFKTMTVGGEVNISGGSLAGKSLRANSAVFSNLTSLSLNDDLNSADHPYALQTVGDMTIVGEQTANINTADAGGSVSATGGSYTGDTITARKDATFSNVSALTINDELTTASGDIAIRKNGVAKVGKLDSGGAFALSGGSYEGATIDTANDAVINGTTYFKVSGNTNIGGKLTATANDDMTFAALKIDENVVASGGNLSAASIETGAKSGANGDFTMTDGSFALGGASHIRGKLDADGNGSSSFGSLTVDGAIKAAGGSISGGTLAAATASFENLSKLEITDSLASKGDLTISGDGIANVKNSSANGEANISGVAYSGSVFSAGKAVFSQMKNLSMSGKLATTGDLSIGMGNGNVAKIDEAESGGTLSLEGGSFSASSLKSGGDAELKNVSSASVSGEATIRGKLSVSGHGSASLGDLRVGETATIDGASLTAKSIETGTKSGSGGHLTVTNGSFDLGSGNAKAGTIHGNLTIDGLGSNSFTELVIDEGLNLSGGYLEGSALTAKTAVFKNNSIAHIDNFVLGGGGNALEIEEGSVVIVRAINNLSGLEEINDSGLIIAGDPSDPDSWSILGDVDLSQGVMTAEKALVQVNSIFGKGQGAKTDDVRAHQISAGNINIEDANIRLTGIGSYASSVRGNLAISENGDTRLGDISVGGETIISGGSV
ncbi:MAG: hypothetical protein K2H64_05570, partial [Desulfovibrio sp.]|nr:hypothetical protein [Desulfovibrio sp.]